MSYSYIMDFLKITFSWHITKKSSVQIYSKNWNSSNVLVLLPLYFWYPKHHTSELDIFQLQWGTNSPLRWLLAPEFCCQTLEEKKSGLHAQELLEITNLSTKIINKVLQQYVLNGKPWLWQRYFTIIVFQFHPFYSSITMVINVSGYIWYQKSLENINFAIDRGLKVQFQTF